MAWRRDYTGRQHPGRSFVSYAEALFGFLRLPIALCRCAPENEAIRAKSTAIVRSPSALVLVVLSLIVGVCFSQPQPLTLIGSWKIEITFSNGQTRSCRFEARPSGKGTLVALIPPQIGVGPNEPGAAQWTQRQQDSVTFSGPVQFPLGNIALERGTLVCEGKLGTDNSISGETKFFSADQDPRDPHAKPSKSGTFKATRVTN